MTITEKKDIFDKSKLGSIKKTLKKDLLTINQKTEEKIQSAHFKEQINIIKTNYGIQEAFNTVKYLQVALNLRKPELAIYDHTFHLIGGGQKYGLTIANALKNIFNITIISNKKITHEDIRTWYNLDLSDCIIKIIPIPFFEDMNLTHLDPNHINKNIENPFHIISKESGNYDFFINNSMNEMVYPLANKSIMICHFPERRPVSYFYSERYTYTVYNSKYTASWIKKRWKYTPHKHIYPPVDMQLSKEKIEKENIILSVARFEESGSKKQIEMIRTFININKSYPDKLKDWKLILVGGSPKTNKYLDQISNLLSEYNEYNIEIKINISGDKLKSLYKKSKIFWHLCGLNQTDPSLIEHFGMTIVEAMQNNIVPIVFDGGGQKEIVNHNECGYRVNSTKELMKHTINLIQNPNLITELSQNALLKSKQFSREIFETNIKKFFSDILKDYIL